MKKLYIAGPYSSDNVLGVAKNIRVGRSITAELMELGYFVYCPWNDWEIAVLKEIPMEIWKGNGLAWLEVSDVVILAPNWKTSSGTLAEIELAKKLNIPVFYSKEEFLRHEREAI